MLPSLMNASMTGENPMPDRAALDRALSGMTFTRAAPLWSTNVVAIADARPASCRATTSARWASAVRSCSPRWWLNGRGKLIIPFGYQIA